MTSHSPGRGGEADALILVDEADRDVGSLSKALCHAGRGILHRAFSLFILNDAGEILVQQRAAGKRLWPLYWSNSCCSHPRRGESLESATRRRLYEELGLVCDLEFLYKFHYQAQFDESGAEHELCSVFVGRSGRTPRINREEIRAWRWAPPGLLNEQMSGAGPGVFTPWFVLEWRHIWAEHRSAVLA